MAGGSSTSRDDTGREHAEDSAKDPGALRTIGEVAAALGLRQHVLRYWEQQFPTLRPLKRNGGRRYYRPEDVDLLTRIDRLINSEGYTLKGARAAIERGAADAEAQPRAERAASARGEGAAGEAAAQESAAPENMLPALRRIRDRLAAALQA